MQKHCQLEEFIKVIIENSLKIAQAFIWFLKLSCDYSFIMIAKIANQCALIYSAMQIKNTTI